MLNLKYVQKFKKIENKIDLRGKKILVVDDNPLNIKVVSNFLELYNCQIYSVINGQECLDKISNNELFDLILLDEMMPKVSGTATMKKLKERGCKIPIIAFTADAVTGKKEYYLSQGFDDFLSKPIEKDELERVIKRFLIK